MNRKDLLILSHLRENSRATLTHISKKTHMPISTIYDKLKQYENSVIVKHTTLLNFEKLNFNTKAKVLLKASREQRDALGKYLSTAPNVNSLHKVNNGYDYMIEAVFRHIKDLEDFIELLDSKFQLVNKDVYFIIEDIKREGFLNNPELIDLHMSS
ncbi:Lrp/AsnC family transcriptional regulator [Candidatus Woesearchaeota archaeon]|nr:Lrp/AsnC family transcriptional regulator [Candidatus Woesearchaeota archaeon]